MEEDIQLTPELLDEIIKEAYKKGVKDAQGRKERQKEGYKKRIEQEEFYKQLKFTCGSFYFDYYNKFKINEKQYLFRFIYLCTYMNYNNILSNGTRLYLENELEDLLLLSRREYYNTKKFLLDNELIKITKDKHILINDAYCKRGKIFMEKNIEVVRIFDKAIQELYKKSTPKEHKKLSLLIDILPYVNFKHNVICKNPEEEDFLKIQPMTMKELCVAIGQDERKPSLLKNKLFKLTVSGEIVVGIFDKVIGSCIYVNPKVYYKGNNIEELEGLARMFKIGTNI